MKITSKLISSALVLFSIAMSSLSYGKNITIGDAYIRETLPGNSISAAYMTINNKGAKAIKLVNITSDISPRIEIHNHEMHDGMMKMTQLDNLIIAAGQNVVLKPYGLHLMIFNLKKPLKKGENIALTLHFNNQDNITIQVPVVGMGQKQSHH